MPASSRWTPAPSTSPSGRTRIALGKTYPSAAYHLVTSTPGEVEALGGDELLYADGQPRGLPYIAMRTAPTLEFRFAVASSMTDPAEAARLARKYEGYVSTPAMARAAGNSGRALAGACACKAAAATPPASTRFSPGWSMTRSSTSPPRTAWSNMRARPGHARRLPGAG